MQALPPGGSHTRPHALDIYKHHNRTSENVPYSNDAECGVLGCVLVEPALWDKVAEFLDDKCFYMQQHRLIFKAIELLKIENHDIDVITLANKLKELGQLENCGGAGYLTSLINTIQTTSRIASFVRIVFEKWKARSIIQLSIRLQESCVDGSFSEIMVNEFVGAIDKVFNDKTAVRPYSFGENTAGVIDDIAERARQYHQGVPYTTSMPDLDQVTGGLEKKTLSVIGAKSSIGKTSLMTQMAFGLVKHKNRVLYFTTEMPEREIRNRIICSELDLDYFRAIRTGRINDGEREKILEFNEKTKGLEFYIYFKPNLTSQFIVNEINKLSPDFVFVDYFQQMAVTGRERTDREYSKICYEFKDIAGTRNCGIVIASQFSRAMDKPGEKRDKPQLSDLKESGGIEISADLVLLLQRGKANEEAGFTVSYDTHILVGKQRNGPSNVAVGTLFLTRSMKFVQKAKEQDNGK